MANKLDPSTTMVSEVMTPHPTIARMTDSAMDCLGIMIEKHFRHLPVRKGDVTTVVTSDYIMNST